MKTVKKIGLIVLATIANMSIAQEENWMAFPGETKDSSQTVQQELNYDLPDGEITVHKDKRIEDLEKFVRSGEESLDGVLIDGYRVLIYFDQDKQKAEQQKAHFLSLYKEVTAYVDYLAPNYRVRVGNYRTRLEAEKLKQEVLSVFPTAIVVEDKIQLPPLESNGE